MVHPGGSDFRKSSCRALSALAFDIMKDRSSDRSGTFARASCGGRGAQTWMQSSVVVICFRSSGEATTTPRRCPGIAYDLEKEKRWTRVDLHDQDADNDSACIGEKRLCGGWCSTKSRYVSSTMSAILLSRANSANCAMSAGG